MVFDSLSSAYVLQVSVLCVCNHFQKQYRNFRRNLADYKCFKENLCITAILFSQDSFQ